MAEGIIVLGPGHELSGHRVTHLGGLPRDAAGERQTHSVVFGFGCDRPIVPAKTSAPVSHG